MRRSHLIVTTLVIATVLSACGPNTPAGEGKKLYESGGASMVPCATCHTLDGTELVGPSLQGIASRAGERVPGVSAEDYLEQSILYPSSYLVEGYADSMLDMYSTTLTQSEIEAVVAYLMTKN